MLISLLHEATHGKLGSFYTKIFSETQSTDYNLCSVFLQRTAVWAKGLWRIDQGTGMSGHCLTTVFCRVAVTAILAEMPAVISEKELAGAGDCGRPNCCRQEKRTGGYLKSNSTVTPSPKLKRNCPNSRFWIVFPKKSKTTSQNLQVFPFRFLPSGRN